MTTINLNDKVSFVLTGAGVEDIEKHVKATRSLGAALWNYGHEMMSLKAGDTWSGQLWFALEVFGPGIRLGRAPFAERATLTFGGEE